MSTFPQTIPSTGFVKNLTKPWFFLLGNQSTSNTPLQLRVRLARDYGGESTLLIQLPLHLKSEVVLQECERWVGELGVTVRPFVSYWKTFRHPVYMIKISIYDFPLDFWDPFFFEVAVEGFGLLSEVIPEEGNIDMRKISLKIECKDPFAIPEYLIFDFHSKWKDCKVEVDSWSLARSPVNCDGEELLGLEEFNFLSNEFSEADNNSTPFSTLMDCHKRYLWNRMRYGNQPRGGGNRSSAMEAPNSNLAVHRSYKPGVGTRNSEWVGAVNEKYGMGTDKIRSEDDYLFRKGFHSS